MRQSYTNPTKRFNQPRWLAALITFNLLIAFNLLTAICSAQGNDSAPPNTSASTQSLPDIVYILGDDQAWTDYGFMNHAHIQTPNLDRLAREGLLYTRGYVPDSLCRPSLATMISGLYPHQHGIVGNDPPPSASDKRAKAGRGGRYRDADYQSKSKSTSSCISIKSILCPTASSRSATSVFNPVSGGKASQREAVSMPA